MDFGNRLKTLRAHRGMTQKELGDAIGLTAVSIGCWETGKKSPSMNAVIDLAKALKVSTDYLLGMEEKQSIMDVSVLTPSEETLITNYRILDNYGQKMVDTVIALERSRVNESHTEKIIPIRKPLRYIPKYLTPSAAGYSAPLDGEEFEMILADENVPHDADFAVRIQGDSMYPYIKDGDTVFVKKDSEVGIGDVGIFAVNGAMYCKQYYIDEEGNLTLVSANPDLRDSNVYVSAESSSDVQCCGKVLLGRKIDLPDYLFEEE